MSSSARDRLDAVQAELSQLRAALLKASQAAADAVADPAVQSCAPAARCLTRVATTLAGLPSSLVPLRYELRLAEAHLAKPPLSIERTTENESVGS